MAQNFIQCDREQLLMMAPSPREWLPENHLAWFVIDAVEDMNLSAFYARYRQDGWATAVSRVDGAVAASVAGAVVIGAVVPIGASDTSGAVPI